MKKLYESQNSLVVTTENEDVSNPIYVFYKSKVALVNYKSPNTTIVDNINELNEIIKSIILYGRQCNKYVSEIDYYTKFQARNEEDLSKFPNPVPKEDQKVYDIFVSNIDHAKKQLEKLKFLQEGSIDSVIDAIRGVVL